jgi:hypothetical protein
MDAEILTRNDGDDAQTAVEVNPWGAATSE